MTSDPGSTCEINFYMMLATIEKLQGGGYSLYGFKAVKGDYSVAPLVWFRIPPARLVSSSVLSWREQYHVYSSAGTSVRPDMTVNPGDLYPVNPGDSFEVQRGGAGIVKPGAGDGHPGISFRNRASEACICGIAQQGPDGSVTPYSVFPLNMNYNAFLTPVRQVLLMFSTTDVPVGTYLAEATGPGILLDLDRDGRFTIVYDTETTGWRPWPREAPAKPVPPGSRLSEFLIQPPTRAA